MTQKPLICALILSFLLLLAHANSASASIELRDGSLSEDALALLNLFAKDAPCQARLGMTIEQADAFAQRRLARPRQVERLSEVAVRHYTALWERFSGRERARVRSLLEKLELTRDVEPPKEEVDFVIINGSTAQNVRQRIAWVAQSFEKGELRLSRSAQIIFLDGERPLFSSESAEVLLSPAPFARDEKWHPPSRLPKDERQMVEMMWQQMKVPEKLRRYPISFFHAPRRANESRAQTGDCAQMWLRRGPALRGRALVVSSNPHVEYQRQIFVYEAQKAGNRSLLFEGTGPYVAPAKETPDAVKLGILIDAFAATLHMVAANRAQAS